MTTTQTTPPGWYPDPQGPGQRYFDGEQWTEHRSGAQQLPPTPPPVVGPGYAQARPPKKNNAWKWILGGFGALIVIVAIANSSGTSTGEKGSESGSSGSKAASSGKKSEKAEQKA